MGKNDPKIVFKNLCKIARTIARDNDISNEEYIAKSIMGLTTADKLYNKGYFADKYKFNILIKNYDDEESQGIRHTLNRDIFFIGCFDAYIINSVECSIAISVYNILKATNSIQNNNLSMSNFSSYHHADEFFSNYPFHEYIHDLISLLTKYLDGSFSEKIEDFINYVIDLYNYLNIDLVWYVEQYNIYVKLKDKNESKRIDA